MGSAAAKAAHRCPEEDDQDGAYKKHDADKDFLRPSGKDEEEKVDDVHHEFKSVIVFLVFLYSVRNSTLEEQDDRKQK